jgi:hypothetical protein
MSLFCKHSTILLNTHTSTYAAVHTLYIHVTLGLRRDFDPIGTAAKRKIGVE